MNENEKNEQYTEESSNSNDYKWTQTKLINPGKCKRNKKQNKSKQRVRNKHIKEERKKTEKKYRWIEQKNDQNDKRREGVSYI